MLNELKNLHPRPDKKRLGRGIGSGTGKTSGKGHKGQNARSGGGTRPGFEGGQLPLFQRLPKRGFHSLNQTKNAIVSLDALNCFEADTVVTVDLLLEKGLVSKPFKAVKVLNGELSKKLTLKVHQISKSALTKLQELGGTFEAI